MVSTKPAAVQTALIGTPTEDEATRAAQSAQEKLKAEKARKKRLARERVKSHEEPGSRQQDQMYYGYAVLDALQRRSPTRRVPANGSLNRAA
jgi:acetyl-CoA carboxylase carboxyltransferase component